MEKIGMPRPRETRATGCAPVLFLWAIVVIVVCVAVKAVQWAFL